MKVVSLSISFGFLPSLIVEVSISKLQKTSFLVILGLPYPIDPRLNSPRMKTGGNLLPDDVSSVTHLPLSIIKLVLQTSYH